MGISPAQLLIVLLIVALLFGTKKLSSFGGDLGSAIKGFKKAMAAEDEPQDNTETQQLPDNSAEDVVMEKVAATNSQ